MDQKGQSSSHLNTNSNSNTAVSAYSRDNLMGVPSLMGNNQLFPSATQSYGSNTQGLGQGQSSSQSHAYFRNVSPRLATISHSNQAPVNSSIGSSNNLNQIVLNNNSNNAKSSANNLTPTISSGTSKSKQSHLNNIPLSGGGHYGGRKQQTIGISSNGTGLNHSSSNSHSFKHSTSSNMTGLSQASSKIVHRQGSSSGSSHQVNSQIVSQNSQVTLSHNRSVAPDFEISPKNSTSIKHNTNRIHHNNHTSNHNSSKFYGNRNLNVSSSTVNNQTSQTNTSQLSSSSSQKQNNNNHQNNGNKEHLLVHANSSAIEGQNPQGHSQLHQTLPSQQFGNYPHSVKNTSSHNSSVPLSRQQTVIHNKEQSSSTSIHSVIGGGSNSLVTHQKSSSQQNNQYGLAITGSNQASSSWGARRNTQNQSQIQSQNHLISLQIQQQFELQRNESQKDRLSISRKTFDPQQTVRIKEKLESLLQVLEYERNFCDQIDADDQQIRQVALDLENQRVVRADAERSRGAENLNKDAIEQILTLYCKRNDLKYKQGLNEILAPFVYLQQQCSFESHFSYNCFSAFIWRYLTTFYQDEEFHTLQIALSFLQLLLKYHDPELALYLETNSVTPEIYAIPWFLTYFANKFEIDILIDFWDMIVQEDDQIFIFFFSVALILQNKQNVLEGEQSHLPQILSKITIETTEQLKSAWQKAIQLMDSTPYSFKELNEIKQIFSVDLITQDKEVVKEILERVENIPCLPVMAEELFFYAYPETLTCSNPKCLNSMNGFKMNHSIISGLQSPSMSSQYSLQSMTQGQTPHLASGNSTNPLLRRQSLGLEEHDMMSPVREYSGKHNNQHSLEFTQKQQQTLQQASSFDDSYQVQFQQQQRRMTAAESTTNKSQLQLIAQQSKKANIHDIIKKEINNNSNSNTVRQQTQLQQPSLNTRMTSSQASPIKGQFSSQHQQYAQNYQQSLNTLGDQDYYKGIDISSSRSPFKNVNKQSPAKADGMPLETDSNVYDDGQEQQESHIDLINETTRMKHLSQTEEQKMMMLRRQQNQGQQKMIMTVQEPRVGSSPKAVLSSYMGSFQQSDKIISNKQQYKSSSHYQKGLSASACKVNNKLSNTANFGSSVNATGSLIDNKRVSVLQPSLLQSTALNIQRLDLCKKCTKKKEYEEKQQIYESQDSEFQISIQETNSNLLEEESHDFYYEKIRFLIVDCRLESLQKEALLPNSFQLQIQTECNIEYLQEQTDKLLSCKDIYHICLVGLDPLQPKFGKKLDSNQGESTVDLKSYHESILRFLIEDFQLKGFKYISVIPGGFKECHEMSNLFNFQILNHEKSNCYYCDSKGDKHSYDQQYNIASDIFSGFKHWYDVANTKLKSFVKGPIKILGNNNQPSQSNGAPSAPSQQKAKANQSIDSLGSLSNQSSMAPTKQSSESRNNGPHQKQGKHQHKTTEDQNRLLSNSQHQLEQDQTGNYQVTTLSGLPNNNNQNSSMNMQPQDAQSDKASEISLGSLPISFVSQSSRQELFSQFQGSQCSSNVPVSSSQNDGNNLRDAISNKKIMSYKLMSKVPGDRNDASQHLLLSNADVNLLQGQSLQQSLDARANQNTLGQLHPNSFAFTPEYQAQLIQQQQQLELIQSHAKNQSTINNQPNHRDIALIDLNDQNTIRVELTQQQNQRVQQQQLKQDQSNNQTRQQQIEHQNQQQLQAWQQHQQQLIQQKQLLLQQKVAEAGQLVKQLSTPAPSQQEEKKAPQNNQQDYYYKNCTTQCFDINRQDFESLANKKSSVVYKCLKLYLRKKDDPPQQVMQQQQLAYHVNLIITPYTVSVLKENFKLKSSMSFLSQVGIMNQSIESSMSHMDEWDQNDFDELHPHQMQQDQQLQEMRRNRLMKQGSNQGPFAYLESRFMMHDLIKITSRKSSTKIITFYFRIPLYEDYNVQALEQNIVQQLDQPPAIKYKFAFNRKEFKEVSMSFEFSMEEEAKQCISNVSSIYKKLKNKK